MSEPSKEMTLRQWVESLPPSHRVRKEYAELLTFVRHKKDCKVNPGGKVMEALGFPEKHPCTCGLDSLITEEKPEEMRESGSKITPTSMPLG